MFESSNVMFTFTLFRFIGPKGSRTMEIVRDFSVADGMRALVENSERSITTCRSRVQAWADTHGLAVIPLEPYPSARYPGKAWLEFRFGSLML